jgi:hypothetical protein
LDKVLALVDGSAADEVGPDDDGPDEDGPEDEPGMPIAERFPLAVGMLSTYWSAPALLGGMIGWLPGGRSDGPVAAALAGRARATRAARRKVFTPLNTFVQPQG